MGVPVVTLSGRTALQRSGLSIAVNLGLPELALRFEDEFVESAIALATDLPRLSGLRATIPVSGIA
jgi:predicted O-linked N-acetylglucosamine transferase (SPINDLY family)